MPMAKDNSFGTESLTVSPVTRPNGNPRLLCARRSDTPTQFPIRCVAVSDRSARCVGGSGLNHGERYCVTHGAWDVSPKRKRSTDRLFQPIERPSCDESVAFRQRFHFKLGEKAMTAPRVMSSAEMVKKMSSSGVEPDLRPSQSRVLSLTLQGPIMH